MKYFATILCLLTAFVVNTNAQGVKLHPATESVIALNPGFWFFSQEDFTQSDWMVGGGYLVPVVEQRLSVGGLLMVGHNRWRSEFVYDGPFGSYNQVFKNRRTVISVHPYADAYPCDGWGPVVPVAGVGAHVGYGRNKNVVEEDDFVSEDAGSFIDYGVQSQHGALLQDGRPLGSSGHLAAAAVFRQQGNRVRTAAGNRSTTSTSA